MLLHDYQLYLVASDVRAACPGAFLHQFIHIPWPQSDYWRVLPTQIREAVFRGLLGNDVVAFHTRHYVSNFLRGCADLLDLEVDEARGVVHYDGREVWVRAYPVSIDPASLRDAAGSTRAHAAELELVRRRREHLLLRVDRLDLSKNIIRGFVALDRFLELHPEFKERFTFLALLQPSREDVEEYVTYRERVERIVADVNTRHGTTDWMPIDLRIQDDFPVTLAAYAQYDVLLVNAIGDGMNLVAKEGPILNRHDGVLVLSEYAGAYEELGAFALGVNPLTSRGRPRRCIGRSRCRPRSAPTGPACCAAWWRRTASRSGSRRSSPTSPPSSTPPADGSGATPPARGSGSRLRRARSGALCPPRTSVGSSSLGGRHPIALGMLGKRVPDGSPGNVRMRLHPLFRVPRGSPRTECLSRVPVAPLGADTTLAA